MYCHHHRLLHNEAHQICHYYLQRFGTNGNTTFYVFTTAPKLRQVIDGGHKVNTTQKMNIFAVVDVVGRLELPSTLACSNLVMLQQTSEMQGLAFRHEMGVLQSGGMW